MWSRQIKSAIQGIKNFNVISVAQCAEAVVEENALKAENDAPTLLQRANAIADDKNPGTYEGMAGQAKAVLNPDVFDGCRIEYVIPHAQTLISSHCLWMGSSVIPGGGLYQGGTTWVIDEEAGAFAISRMDHNGRLDVQAVLPLFDGFSTKLQLHTPIGTLNPFGETNKAAMMDPSQAAQGVLDMDIKANDYSINCRMGKANDGQPPFVSINYLQHITSTICLGAEGFYHSASKKSAIGFGGKWTGEDDFFTATIGPSLQTISCDYLRKVTDRVNLATELTLNYGAVEATAMVGAEFTMRTSKLTMKCDQSGKIGSLLELMIAPGAAFLLTADLDNSSGEHKVGYGLRIGQ